MPRRTHAPAAALSWRRFARCSSLKSCTRQKSYPDTLFAAAPALRACRTYGAACQRAEAPKLVLLQLLPGVVVLVSPVIGLQVGHLLRLVPTALHTAGTLMAGLCCLQRGCRCASSRLSCSMMSVNGSLELVVILPGPGWPGRLCCCWHERVLCSCSRRALKLRSSGCHYLSF
jgi:hypothetical protein